MAQRNLRATGAFEKFRGMRGQMPSALPDRCAKTVQQGVPEINTSISSAGWRLETDGRRARCATLIPPGCGIPVCLCQGVEIPVIASAVGPMPMRKLSITPPTGTQSAQLQA
jgi:hypothetical protein